MDISQVLVSIADSLATATATAEAETLTPPETPASFNVTQRVLVHMLRENTGASILDSGGANGRHWQRNQLVDFSKREAATVEFRSYQYGDKPAQLEANVTLDLFHFLSNVCTYDRALTRQIRKFAALPANADSHWLEIARTFPEWIGDKRGEDVSNVACENTYNVDNFLSQDIQFVHFTLGCDSFVILQIHNGADARGGYTAPQVFALDDEWSICNYHSAGIAPAHAEVKAMYAAIEAEMERQPSLFASLDAERRAALSGVLGTGNDVFWDIGSNEYNGEGCKALDSYPVIEVDSREEWKPGHVCVLPDHSALCPVTGAPLRAFTSY